VCVHCMCIYVCVYMHEHNNFTLEPATAVFKNIRLFGENVGLF